MGLVAFPMFLHGGHHCSNYNKAIVCVRERERERGNLENK